MKAVVLIFAVAACYEPQARDCTVTCSAATECANGQVCGGDGFCAAREIAGQCASLSLDAGTTIQMVSLRILIEGDGRVSIDDVGHCDSATSRDCTFAVTPNIARQLKAVEKDDREFVTWTATCVGEQTSCAITPVMSVTQVGAKFE